MMDLTKAALFFPFLTELPEVEQVVLAAGAREIRQTKGHLLLTRGDVIDGAFLVLRGELQVFTLSAEGREAPVHMVRGGESCIFALNALFSQVVYPAWVRVASTEVVILCLEGRVFRQLFEDYRPVRDWVLSVQSQRIFDLVSTLEETQLLSVEERLQSFLLRQVGPGRRIRMTHEEIARYIGTSREVVSRHLRKLVDTGAIVVRRKEIEVVETSALLPGG